MNNDAAEARPLASRRAWAYALVVGLGVAWTIAGPWVPAAPGDNEDARQFENQARAFLAKHCVECHGAEKPKGKFRVDQLAPDFADKGNRERWLAVQAQLKTDAMPPKGKARPPEKDSQGLQGWVDQKVAAA